MNNDSHINCVICFDQTMKELDGKGWCVRFSNSSGMERFATLSDAQLFITDNSWYFLPSMV